MEKVTINQSENANSILTLTNRKKITLTNVNEIISSNETNIFLKVAQAKAQISGNSINITKLDIASGLLEAEGNFNCIKYDNKLGSRNIFKRLFK